MELGDSAAGDGASPPDALPMGARVPDLAEVRGQPEARRALEIALAGRHGLLLVGPPGSGKTLLARTIPGLLPPLDDAAALAATVIASAAAEGPILGLRRRPPFRAPHHTISYAAMVGGGPRLSPGEVTLADQGVLFLDELPEFDRDVLEALRQPLEEGRVAIARAGRATIFPARFQLVAAMNPCPCGYAGARRSTVCRVRRCCPSATSDGSRVRSATGSTSGSRCPASRPVARSAARSPRIPATVAHGSPRPARGRAQRGGER